MPDGVVPGTCAGGVVRGGAGAGGCEVTAGAVVLAGAGSGIVTGIVTGVEDGVLAGAGEGAARRSPPARSGPAAAGIPVVRAGSDATPLATENAVAEGDVTVVVGRGAGLSAAASVGR
ncbi:hypothetical protein [Pseudofrankia inefficax]|nr:hypothetical protein [Pseudofrankia inefficax]